MDATADKFDGGGHRRGDDDLDRFREQGAAKDFVGPELVEGHCRQGWWLGLGRVGGRGGPERDTGANRKLSTCAVHDEKSSDYELKLKELHENLVTENLASGGAEGGKQGLRTIGSFCGFGTSAKLFGVALSKDELALLTRSGGNARRLRVEAELTELGKGMLRVRLRLNSLEEVERWILSIGGHGTVIRPDALRLRLSEVGREQVAKYGDGGACDGD